MARVAAAGIVTTLHPFSHRGVHRRRYTFGRERATPLRQVGRCPESI
jgi:hypothetical protein